MNELSAPSAQPRRRRWPALLLGTGSAAVAVFAVVLFGLPPNVPSGPVSLARGEDAQWIAKGSPERPGGVFWEVHAGKIAAKNTFNSSSTSSRSDHSGFACGRVLIVNRSDHVLMARIGRLLPEQLKTQDFVRRIDYYPAGAKPEPGELAPDVTITIDLESLTESRWPLWHSVDATFIVTAGNGPTGCAHGYVDHLTPPLVRFDWSGALHHASTTPGLFSSAAKYKLAAEDVARQIAGTLLKEFKGRREKEGTVPELAQAFYPPYREPPALPLAGLGDLEMLASWHGLMNHNETLWRLTADRPVTAVLGAVEQRLKADGWKTLDSSASPDHGYLRMGRQGMMLVAYVPSSREGPPPQEPILNVQYVDRMTQEEVRAAIDQAMAQDASADVLVCFDRLWSDDQSRRILKRLQARPARTPHAALVLARLYHRLKQDDDARGELIRATALLRTIGQYGDLESRIQSLAKELGDEKLAKKSIEPRVLEELGFVELKPGAQVPPQDVGVEEPAHFYAKASNGSLRTISLRVVRSGSRNSETSFQLAHVESTEHGRSWGTSGTSHDFGVDGRCSVHFAIHRTGPGERFRLTADVSGR